MFQPATIWRKFDRIPSAIWLSVISTALAGCEQPNPEVPANAHTEIAGTKQREALPEPVTALSRGDLITVADRAASLYASGESPARVDPLVGRTFSIKIAFGCAGPALPDSPAVAGLAQWSWGRDEKAIELRMTPGDWAASTLSASSDNPPDLEAVEGFWLSRPWLVSDVCPAVEQTQATQQDEDAAPQTLGLAATFEAGGSRIGRRNGRAYAFTIRSNGDTALEAPQKGYRLILRGRIASFPDGRAIRCRAASPDQRPICVFATKLDRIAFEDTDGATLSEWRPG